MQNNMSDDSTLLVRESARIAENFLCPPHVAETSLVDLLPAVQWIQWASSWSNCSSGLDLPTFETKTWFAPVQWLSQSCHSDAWH